MSRILHGTGASRRKPPFVAATRTPSAILGAKLVLDLNSDITVAGTGSGVLTWPDQSGKGNDVTQATAGLQPTLVASVLDGHAAVRHNGSQYLERLTFAGIAAGDRPRIYTIGSYASAAAGAPAGTFIALGSSAALNQGMYICQGGNGAPSAVARITGTFRIASSSNPIGASSVPGLLDSRLDAALGWQLAASNAVIVGTNQIYAGLDFAIDRLYIGVLEDKATYPLVGQTLRHLVVNPAPTATEHAAIIAYLKAQYPSVAISSGVLPAAAPPTLAQINGSKLVLDLNSDVGLTLGTGVAAWADSSGKQTATLVQATGSKQPTVVANSLDGHNALQFLNASSQCLTMPSGLVGIAAGDKPRLYILASFESLTLNQTILDLTDVDGSANRVLWFDAEAASTYCRNVLGAGTIRDAIIPTTIGQKLYDGQINASDQSELSVNGVSQVVSAATAGGLTRAPIQITVGALAHASNWLQGKVYRIAIVNPPPTAAQHAANIEYFRRTYPSAGLGDAYQAILGGLIVERWDCRKNVYAPSGNVLSWKGTEKGYALQPPAAGNAPPLAVDTGYFNNIPVIQCANAGSKYLRNQALPAALFAAGTRPYMIMVARHRTTPAAYSMMFYVRGPDTAAFGLYFYGPGSQMAAYAGTTSVGTFSYAANTPSAFALYYASNGGSCSARDGVAVGAPGAAGNISCDQTELYFGNRSDGAQGGDLSIAMVIACSSLPSATQLLALAQQIRTDFATTDSYPSILGTNLLGYWDARYNVATTSGAVTSWVDCVQGISLAQASAPVRPAFAADGTLFNGLSVVQSTVAGKCLITANLSPLLFAIGSQPWLWTCARLKTIGTGANSTIVEVVDNPVTRAEPVLFTVGGLLKASEGTTNSVTPATYPADVAPHAYVSGYQSGQMILLCDTVAIGTPSGSGLSVLTPGGAKVSLGAAFNGTSPSDTMFATLLAIASAPSAAQQAALLALDKAIWNF